MALCLAVGRRPSTNQISNHPSLQASPAARSVVAQSASRSVHLARTHAIRTSGNIFSKRSASTTPGKQDKGALKPYTLPEERSEDFFDETSPLSGIAFTKNGYYIRKELTHRDWIPWTQQMSYVEDMEENFVKNIFVRKRVEFSGMEHIFSVRDLASAAIEAVKLVFNITNKMINLPRELKQVLLDTSIKEDVVEVTYTVPLGAPGTAATIGKKAQKKTIKFNREGGAKRRVLYVSNDVQNQVREALATQGKLLGVTVKFLNKLEDCDEIEDVSDACGFMLKYPPLGNIPDGVIPPSAMEFIEKIQSSGGMVIYTLPSFETMQFQGFKSWVPPPNADIVLGYNIRGSLGGRKKAYLGTSMARLLATFTAPQQQQPTEEQELEEGQERIEEDEIAAGERAFEEEEEEEEGELSGELDDQQSLAEALAALSTSASGGAAGGGPFNFPTSATGAGSNNHVISPLASTQARFSKTEPMALHATMKQLLSAHAHIGNYVSRWNPNIEPYLLGRKDKIHIFDVAKTQLHLRRALDFVTEITKDGGKIILLSPGFEHYPEFAEYGRKQGHYFLSKWKSGMITNWGAYQKKMRTLVDSKHHLDLKFPTAVVILTEESKNNTILRECRSMFIPVIGLCDTDVDPRSLDYPVPASSSGLQIHYFFTKLFVQAMQRGQELEDLEREEMEDETEGFAGARSQDEDEDEEGAEEGEDDLSEAPEQEDSIEKKGRASFILQSLGLNATPPPTK